MAKLSAFADEVVEDFKGQVQFLVDEKIRYIEPRFINRKNIMDLNSAELNETKTLLDDNGIQVSAIGSPIGKIKLDEPFAEHLEKFKHAIFLAEYFNTSFIRVFSYYAADGENIDLSKDQVLDRLSQQVGLLKGSNIAMVHENEGGIFGHTGENCALMASELASEHFKLVFDPANFVVSENITNCMDSCWPLMKPHIVHIHMKDWKPGDSVGCIPGQGAGQIKELLNELAAMNYDGCITMEPHIKKGGQFGGSTGPELFSDAIAAVRILVKETGLELN